MAESEQTMTETGKQKKSFLQKLNHPLTYWLGGWVILGVALSTTLKHFGVKSYMATGWQMADALILFTIIYFFAKDPVREFLAGRKKEIAASIDTYKKQLAEMEKNFEEIKYRLTWIEDEVEDIEARARADAALDKMRLEEETRKQLERIKNEAEFNAKAEIKTAEARLKAEAIKKALAVAEEILRKRVTDREEEKLFSDYLREVERGAQR